MHKLEELQRIIFEHYTDEQLLEFYKRKIKKTNDKEQIRYYVYKIQDLKEKIIEKRKIK